MVDPDKREGDGRLADCPTFKEISIRENLPGPLGVRGVAKSPRSTQPDPGVLPVARM